MDKPTQCKCNRDQTSFAQPGQVQKVAATQRCLQVVVCVGWFGHSWLFFELSGLIGLMGWSGCTANCRSCGLVWFHVDPGARRTGSHGTNGGHNRHGRRDSSMQRFSQNRSNDLSAIFAVRHPPVRRYNFWREASLRLTSDTRNFHPKPLSRIVETDSKVADGLS